MKHTTTDYNKLRATLRGDASFAFTWGLMVRFYEIGPYGIIEYYQPIFENNTATDKIDYTQTYFHLYLWDTDKQRCTGWDTDKQFMRDCCSSYESLDAALAAGIAYRAEGANHKADRYFIAALKSIQGESQ